MIGKSFISLFCIMFASLTWVHGDHANPTELNAILAIVKNYKTCVKGVLENRIYLKAESIYPTEKGLFLLINDQNYYVLLPKLFSDQFGCFIEFSLEDFETSELSMEENIHVFRSDSFKLDGENHPQ